MSEAWALVIPVEPTFVPSPTAQLQALQFWATQDRQGSSKSVEVHAEVHYYPPADGSLNFVCCPNCRREIDPEWLLEAINEARAVEFTNLLTAIPCCGAFVSLNDLKVKRGFQPFGFARFCLRSHAPDPTCLGTFTLKKLESILGTPLRAVWQQL